ncbi:amidase signature enzyme [Massarina eburnea CBS 473.64]|uniref:Amidase signature enzyme n=1 Tax=Massarina eburnea CBS 473.64 TaxID=1395130 RepID=A0A6A6RT18_9PLEO|nr:amidase signature enzyme [Massarina eburnea CBS 473.64]
MSADRARTSFINYPRAQAYEKGYKAPPPGKNPVVKGYTLHYVANFVNALPLVPYLLWKNAGFESLRALKELNNVEPRYDPSVIPLPQSSDDTPAHYTTIDASSLRVPPQNAPGRFYTIADYHDAYKSGRLTPTSVIEFLLPLIRRDAEKHTPYTTAFIDSNVELVRAAAEASTQRWKEGKPLGVMDGIPFAVKDDVDVKGYRRYVGTTTDFTEGKEVGTSWFARKVEEVGGILVGKCNMHELGMDTTGNNANWGTPLNPYNSRYYPGGSTSGGASAVSSGLIPFAVGSDGGGSIRIPSNYCGLYGLKPSHGRVSVEPLPRNGKSVVVYGPLATSMSDLEISYRVLAQPDPTNPTSSQFAPPPPVQAEAPAVGSRKKILGICRPWFDRAVPQVQEACRSALQYLSVEKGYETIDITMPYITEGQLAHALTILSELLSTQPAIAPLTPANRMLLKIAATTTATDFILAQKLRNLLMQHLAHLFTQHPGLIIVLPTTPNAGWPIGDGEASHGMSDGNMQIFNMEYAWLANFTGVPAIQFPVGYVKGSQGEGVVPVGMQGHGEWGSEDVLIEFGYDGEEWLEKGYQGGKVRSGLWVDVLGGAEVGR